MTLADERADAIAKLTAAGIVDAAREADLLLGVVFPRKYVDYEEVFTPEFAARYREVVARRASREPLSHISGRRAFWNHVFEVSNAVLDPRPDTETLVEAALDLEWRTVLDLGTGSGCILLSLLAEREQARGVGIDISEDALSVAMRNRSALELNQRATLQRGDWLVGLEGVFDLIVSNPPYITQGAYETLQPEVLKFEPRVALTPGGDGLDAYRVLALDTPAHLAVGGTLLLEIGFDQRDAVQEILRNAEWQEIAVIQDLSGHSRVISAKRG
ncbi:MAG: peptide chain release factor N(5)-glutamine methyltransferase [Pseudomonadota bacterium]